MSRAFDDMVDKYSTSIFRCAYAYCNNWSDAKDIMQEVFYKYLSKRPTFKDADHEKAWFLRVTINLSKNYVKSFWNRKTEGLCEDIPCFGQEEKEIWGFVQKLPEKYRVVLELYYWEGYSIKEIADILKKNSSTVGTHLERAKKMLRTTIEGKV